MGSRFFSEAVDIQIYSLTSCRRLAGRENDFHGSHQLWEWNRRRAGGPKGFDCVADLALLAFILIGRFCARHFAAFGNLERPKIVENSHDPAAVNLQALLSNFAVPYRVVAKRP